jgi:bacteriocin-like protein
MKELSIEKLELVQGGSWTEFADGVACGYGLATIATGFGAVLAVYGCGRVLNFW